MKVENSTVSIADSDFIFPSNQEAANFERRGRHYYWQPRQMRPPSPRPAAPMLFITRTTETYNEVHNAGEVLLDVSSSQVFGNAIVQSGSVNLNLSDKSC